MGLLALVTILLAGFFLYTLVADKQEAKTPPRVITKLLTDLVAAGNNPTKRKGTLSLCIDYSDCATEIEASDMQEQDLQNFTEVLTPRDDAVVGDYEITIVTDRFVEIVLLDAKGRPLYPRVGLVYELTDDGLFIKNYTLGRLQPFSRYDEEYSSLWK